MNKLVSREELIHKRESLKQAGRKVVFTNGCFDLLHPGHVRYLEEAKSLGDVLVLGLNSDKSVRKLKGEGRPILNQEERAEVLSGLAAVDFITIFDEETPQSLIAVLQPDVLVKGGDWQIDQIVGKEEVESAGGVVMSLPFVDGSSTSDIINRIHKLKK